MSNCPSCNHPKPDHEQYCQYYVPEFLDHQDLPAPEETNTVKRYHSRQVCMTCLSVGHVQAEPDRGEYSHILWEILETRFSVDPNPENSRVYIVWTRAVDETSILTSR